MLKVVVLGVLSSNSLGVIFSGRDPEGNAHRFVAGADVLPRAPVVGETWSIAGRFETHSLYGRQARVHAGRLERPSGRMLVDLLQGPRFRNVGQQTAQALWDAFGEDLYGILAGGNAAAIVEVLGDTRRTREQAATLVFGWRDIETEAEVYRWLDRHGFPPRLGRKLLDCYGPDAITGVSENPYRLLAFAGWRRVDETARALGIARRDRRRLVGAVEAALYARLDDCHTWTAEPELLKQVERLLCNPTLGSVALREAEADYAATLVRGGWQSAGVHALEAHVAERCSALVEGWDEAESTPWLLHLPVSETLLTNVMARSQTDTGLIMNAAQRQAVHAALTHPLCVVTGGAGVGKTMVLKAVGAFADAVGIAVHQMALSGRAALRIAETTGRPARTIAGWLAQVEMGSVPLDDSPLVVIDEASMVDLSSLYRVLRCLEPGCRLLLVGDPGQLPPVGFGLTFHVLAADLRVPQVHLTEVMRQSAATGIPQVAQDIREGRPPALPPFEPAQEVGVSFVEAPREKVVQVVLDVLSAVGGIGSAQIVGAVKGRGKKDDGGIVAINEALHAIVATRGAPPCAGASLPESRCYGRSMTTISA